ncbi:MAG: hypothetical protein QXD71_02325 [Candidatus Pacearchaeota archaeon]
MFLRSRNKKGQAAMEFLMTYGWAILIAIIAIAALIAFGVLNPPVQEVCGTGGVLIQGVTCEEVTAIANQSNISFLVFNGAGKTIYIKDNENGDITFEFYVGKERKIFSKNANATNHIKIEDGQTVEIVVSDDDAIRDIIPNTPGKALKGDLKFSYCFSVDESGVCQRPIYQATVRVVKKIATR